MFLSKHSTPLGPRWAVDGFFLQPGFSLGLALQTPLPQLPSLLKAGVSSDRASGAPLAPIDDAQEVWACGVTYLRSRDARKEESQTADVYQKVYEAERPEIFFKSNGWRVRGPGEPIRVRADSGWNVPEPEMTLVVNAFGDIVGYTAGNDVSSRDIEGANPLYLPQAKVYNGACALGPGIELCEPADLQSLPIRLTISRAGAAAFAGETSTANMKRKPAELASYLFRELAFPAGALVLTGTGIIPPNEFSLTSGDSVRIQVGELTLENTVE